MCLTNGVLYTYMVCSQPGVLFILTAYLHIPQRPTGQKKKEPSIHPGDLPANRPPPSPPIHTYLRTTRPRHHGTSDPVETTKLASGLMAAQVIVPLWPTLETTGRLRSDAPTGGRRWRRGFGTLREEEWTSFWRFGFGPSKNRLHGVCEYFCQF